MRFSRRYASYVDWARHAGGLLAHKRMSRRYFERIKKGHKKYPGRTLKELRGHPPKIKVPLMMWRISVAINCHARIFKEDRDPMHDIPVRNEYYGFLYQEFSLDEDVLDVDKAESECIKWTGKALKLLSQNKIDAPWPMYGYPIGDWWFSYQIGIEKSKLVVYDKDYVETWIFQVEAEDGRVIKSDSGPL